MLFKYSCSYFRYFVDVGLGYSSQFRVVLLSCVNVLRALCVLASFVDGVDEMLWVVVFSEDLV